MAQSNPNQNQSNQNQAGQKQGGQIATHTERPLMRRWRNFDNLFDRLFRGWLGPFDEEVGSMRLWDVHMSQNDKEVVVRADVPGFDDNGIDVQVSGDMLTIRADKENKSDGHEEYRSYFRSITLPAGIDASKVEATCKNGVLELHLPRTEETQPRRIKIGQHAATLAKK